MPINTLDYIEKFGFQRVSPTAFASIKLSQRLKNGDVEVFPSTTKYLEPIVQFLGSYKSARTAGYIEFALPVEFESEELLLAVLAYNFRNVEFDETPEWYTRGMALQDELPWRKEALEWRHAPGCFVEHADFKVIEEKLQPFIKEAKNEDIVELTFNGEILRLAFSQRSILAQAHGEKWEKSYTVRLGDLHLLPRRIRKRGVGIKIIRSTININGTSIPLLEKET